MSMEKVEKEPGIDMVKDSATEDVEASMMRIDCKLWLARRYILDAQASR